MAELNSVYMFDCKIFYCLALQSASLNLLISVIIVFTKIVSENRLTDWSHLMIRSELAMTTNCSSAYRTNSLTINKDTIKIEGLTYTYCSAQCSLGKTCASISAHSEDLRIQWRKFSREGFSPLYFQKGPEKWRSRLVCQAFAVAQLCRESWFLESGSIPKKFTVGVSFDNFVSSSTVKCDECFLICCVTSTCLWL